MSYMERNTDEMIIAALEKIAASLEENTVILAEMKKIHAESLGIIGDNLDELVLKIGNIEGYLEDIADNTKEISMNGD
jgi:hypothetical protein